ncbi:hypothetical protein [Zunongwangia sp.]|uniref:hypothetical protein n=1 Tax=Zunongwangia sp. TaxID=1965325 RepID=UPI003AA8E829
MKKLTPRPDIGQHKKAYKAFSRFMQFLDVINQEERIEDLASDVEEKINTEIEKVNTVPLKKLNSQTRKSQIKILQIIEKELKLVPKDYYRNTWLGFGIGAFGIPIGVAIGIALDNMGYLGIGLPIGLAIGLLIGIAKDKKAAKEGRQLKMGV